MFLKRSENILGELLPEYKYLEDVIRVIDVPKVTGGRVLRISMNAELEEALGYLSSHSGESDRLYTEAAQEEASPGGDAYVDERFWRWRHYMAERIAARLDRSCPIRG